MKGVILISLLVIFILISSFFIIKSLSPACDEIGCMDKSGCYTKLKYDMAHEFDTCLKYKGFYWNSCLQKCESINYLNRPNDTILCGWTSMQSNFKIININEVEKNGTIVFHYCGMEIIKNNESCNKQEEWEYITNDNCSTLKFK
jgi:hypothetical protein